MGAGWFFAGESSSVAHPAVLAPPLGARPPWAPAGGPGRLGPLRGDVEQALDGADRAVAADRRCLGAAVVGFVAGLTAGRLGRHLRQEAR